MKLSRNYVTPFVSLVFIVVGLSGLLMFFHLFDGYTEIAHEYLGIFFVICAILHIAINWKALKIHFKKGVFIPAASAIAITSALFVVLQQLHPKVDTLLLERITKAPIGDVFTALQIDHREVTKKLAAKGISLQGATTVEDIWIKNNTSPEEVFDLILQ